jgi:hypothetical protein
VAAVVGLISGVMGQAQADTTLLNLISPPAQTDIPYNDLPVP